MTVGLACLDVINIVQSYPIEDSDQRSLDQHSSLGGNAANSSVVLNNLGEKCNYFGTLAKDTLETEVLKAKFLKNGVDISSCPEIEDCVCPNSFIIVNSKTGSRTIIHTNKNLPEVSLAHFKENVNLDDYSWIHFEGRNLENVKQMIAYVRESKVQVTISVEVEKIKRNFEELIPLGDIVFVSKDVALNHGAKNKIEAIELFKNKVRPNAKLLCAWGDQGAAGLDSDHSQIHSIPAFPPAHGIVDTIGAGDTFNASAIGALNQGCHLAQALEVACRVAGAKVGQKGFQGLSQVYKNGLGLTRGSN